MTGAPIDASLRRPNIRDEDTGTVIPDSRSKLDDLPIVVMEPGVEQFSLQFTDKKGLTDDYGNVYAGYGSSGSGGFSISQEPAKSIDAELDDANDGDIPVYVATELKFLPFSFENAGIARVSITDTPNNRDLLQWDSTESAYMPRTHFEAGVAEIDSTVPNVDDVLVYDDSINKYVPQDIIDYLDIVQHDGSAPVEGDILIYKAGPGKYSPGAQIVTEWVQFIIEKPTNRQYRFSESLPYAITITGTSFVLESGSGSVAFPSGTVSSGSPAFITVSGTTGSSSFLRAQIRYTRNLNVT